MDVAARVTCKGQITIPKAIRDALSLDDGDQVLFRLEGDRAVIAKTPTLLELEGTLSELAPRKVTQWDGIIGRTRPNSSNGHSPSKPAASGTSVR